ncbi:MoxR family ATPase [Streptomyces sp. NBC_01387]|uniref:AAA family ATPase n=1 Tax=unclassified Streptomyces TaxID=2593676 RepID=UPI0020244F61|nr:MULTISPECIES: MoxR family ATPase [unclassified Streptomyces]MCX4548252.1 MoxR family ATPase [Streptomyces sp. NBC_01500]WSC19902.1 MoxR family ATPase [Streptomyces sp. NBC_01766]WSV53921.1 MoxR family ATPase [Streptomyces sp. NBC_01014]
MSDWFIYRGTGAPDPTRIDRRPEPPPWRAFDAPPVPYAVPPADSATQRRLGHRVVPLAVPGSEALRLINAALYLRRPLLITGEPGSGKSTLAHDLAFELGLGRVLQWPVVSRTELRDGLYSYDAIGRLQDAQLSRIARPESLGGHEGRESGDGSAAGTGDIGRYLRLGPLGTALLAADRPRVLLIDELDKSDIDLPNDLLNVLEEGEFTLPELERVADRPGQETVQVLTDDGLRVPVTGGRVRCRAFPVVVMTSNRERDFPAPLLRRCIHLDLEAPRDERLAAMVQAHFGAGAYDEHIALVDQFVRTEADGGVRPTDQLLNAIYLVRQTTGQESVADLLMRPLDNGPR